MVRGKERIRNILLRNTTAINAKKRGTTLKSAIAMLHVYRSELCFTFAAGLLWLKFENVFN